MSTFSWKDVVRAEATPAKPRANAAASSTASSSSALRGSRVLVVDAGPLILGTAPLAALVLQHGFKLVSTQSVLGEVKDEKAKAYIASLPAAIEVKSATAEAAAAIEAFAAQTGDAGVLSGVDKGILALAYAMEKEVHGSVEHLKTKPDSVNTSSKRDGAATRLPGFGSWDDEDEVSGWITPSNVHSVGVTTEKVEDRKKEDEGKKEKGKEAEGAQKKAPENASKSSEALGGPMVACMTTDFAMQNVLLRMGLRVYGLDGLRLRHVKQWVMRCHGCFKVARPTRTSEFCEYCGNQTMQRVSVSVDSDGKKTYHVRSRPPPIRGTKYSLPAPKGGRAGNNMILSEDQLLEEERKAHKKKAKDIDLFDPDQAFFGKTSARSDIVVGFGRRNPNDRMQGRRRKKK